MVAPPEVPARGQGERDAAGAGMGGGVTAAVAFQRDYFTALHPLRRLRCDRGATSEREGRDYFLPQSRSGGGDGSTKAAAASPPGEVGRGSAGHRGASQGCRFLLPYFVFRAMPARPP